jgi:ADP-heptose:LPS heptosyltransferase
MTKVDRNGWRVGDLLPRRVAVLRALKLGDLLCAIPALRALREAMPQAEIALVGLPWAAEFVERFHTYLDRFIEFPGYPGLPEREPDVGRIPAFLAEMQGERFDLVLQMHGSGPFVNPLTVLFGGRVTAGFFLPGGYCPDARWFCPFPTSGLEVERLLQLTDHLGIPRRGEHLEFPLHDRDFEELESVAGANQLRPGEYVCVHAGAAAPERRWPVDRFASVAAALAGRGLRVALTGTAAESALTRIVAGAVPAAIDLAGQTNLGTLAGLLSGARLLICNDTGVSHLAAALRVPSVVVSTGDNPSRWAPSDSRRHRVVCRSSGVSADEVIGEAARLLAGYPDRSDALLARAPAGVAS